MTNSIGVADGRVQEHSVALKEFFEVMANWISQLSDADSVHQTAVSQLTHAQVFVKHLEEKILDL